jgi:hypothetical protein
LYFSTLYDAQVLYLSWRSFLVAVCVFSGNDCVRMRIFRERFVVCRTAGQAEEVPVLINYYYLLTVIGLMFGGSVTIIGRTYKKWTYIAWKQNVHLTKKQHI